MAFFLQRSVDRTRNDAWFNNCLSKWYYIRNTLGISPATTLNMYTCRFANPDMIGDATPPWFFGENEKSHGVAILFETLPGGGLVTLNLGDNAVHEVSLGSLSHFKNEIRVIVITSRLFLLF